MIFCLNQDLLIKPKYFNVNYNVKLLYFKNFYNFYYFKHFFQDQKVFLQNSTKNCKHNNNLFKKFYSL